MELEECQKYLAAALKDEFSIKTIEASSPLLFELHNLLGLAYTDVLHLCLKFKDIFNLNQFELVNNLNALGKSFNLRSPEIKHLFLKEPWLMKLKSPVFKFQVDLLSLTFDASSRDALKLLYHYPELGSLTKDNVKAQIELIAREFNEYGLGVRKQFRREPRLLFVSRADIAMVKKFLMHKFTLSEAEVQHVLRTAPEVALFSKAQLSSLFCYLYPEHFIKRDLKEMFSACPELLLLDKRDFKKKIEQLSLIFSIETKEACKMIRNEPSIMFFDLPSKIQGYEKVGVNIHYLVSHPSLCMLPEIALPLRLVITKIFSLEKNFGELCKLDLGLLISRIMFMQSYNQFDHEDLLLPEVDFALKYNISTKVLLISYRMDRQVLENLVSYYVNLKTKAKGIVDLAFPSEQDMLDFINNKFDVGAVRGAALPWALPNNERELVHVLLAMQLSTNEIRMILSKNPMLCLYPASDLSMNINLLRKNGLGKEAIMRLLLYSTTIFSYSVKDLDQILKAGMEKELLPEEILKNLM